ncbi:pyruvate ferredoxin oxidoreductase [Candidatus Bathyarchaeota archaeon]|nr:pyruvate ferredoxin oxidoreductase [Candidatus Bathyarchaeota archaeon]
MGRWEVMVGNKAIAYAAKLARVQFISAYPITPQTSVVEYLAEMVASGELDAEFVNVEGELTAQTAALGASAAGARAFTATSGPGLLYMHHPMHATSGGRFPVVMAVIHRSVKGMQPDHSDMMSQRDTGWIMLECENSQELLDTGIMAFKIAEDERVRLPTIFAGDGYILSYTAEPVEIPSQGDVDAFLPPYRSNYPLLPGLAEEARRVQMEQWGIGQDPQLRWRRQQEAMEAAKMVIREVNEEFYKWFGRRYGNGLVEEYKCDDVEAFIVAMGTIASTARAAIDRLQARGRRIGLVKLKSFRPFPSEEFRRLGAKVRAIGVIDRNISLGSGGITFQEIRSSLYDLEERPRILGFHAGLSGKEVRVGDIEMICEKTLRAAKGEGPSSLVEWI